MRKNLMQFTLRIEKSLLIKLSYIAMQECRSKNREIEQLIKRRIAKFEAEHGKIEV